VLGLGAAGVRSCRELLLEELAVGALEGDVTAWVVTSPEAVAVIVPRPRVPEIVIARVAAGLASSSSRVTVEPETEPRTSTRWCVPPSR